MPRAGDTDGTLGNPHVAVVARRAFAFGLFWQPAREAASAAREARALARADGIKASFFVVRREPEALFGLCGAGRGLRPGLYAAAPTAANGVAGSWVGAFAVGDAWWVVAVRDDIIVADGDRVHVDEEAARLHFAELVATGGWRRIFAPGPDWAGEAIEMSVEDMLDHADSPRLKPVNSQAQLLRNGAIGLAALAGVGAVGGLGWLAYDLVVDWLTPAPIAGNQMQKPLEWTVRPAPATFLAACLEQTRAMPQAVPGYTLASGDCTAADRGGSARVAFQRSGGQPSWFEASLRGLDRSKGLSIATPATGPATITAPIPKLPARGDEAIHRRQTVQKLLGFNEVQGNTVTLSAPRADPAPADPNAPRRNYVSMRIEVRTDAIEAWSRIIGEIPGLVLDSVDWHMQGVGTTWTLKGQLYALE